MSRSTPSQKLPKYRHHKARNLAVVRIAGHDFYLGAYNSPESHAEYRRLVAEWVANGITPEASDQEAPPDRTITIAKLMVAYVKHADEYYVKDGRPTSEPSLIRLATRVLHGLYGHTLARDFGPLSLKTVRQAYIDDGLCRSEVNRRTGLVVRMFRWAVENELVPPSVHHGLRAVPGLRKGRSGVREAERVKPVSDAHVDAVQPHVSRQVWAMVELQRLTGMRPGEVCIMRTMDLDISGEVWTYTPGSHKTEHHGRERTIFVGPRAQAILCPWLKPEPSAYLFSPREAMAEAWAEWRRNRKTKVQPSQVCRRQRSRKSPPGECYTSCSYRRAIARGCVDAGVAEWHPNQLRHASATRLRRDYGLDVARVVLGHSSPIITEVYAELDHEKARQTMKDAG